jgi:acetate kinase
VSARHCHLTRETVEALFGEGYELTPKRELSQPGQFAAEERIRVIGPEGSFDRVRILGPVREEDQVEISRTDEFHLGIDAPVRMSGDIDNTPGAILEGPEGRVQLDKGVICAWRHIHMTPEDAERFGVDHRDVVEVAVDTPERDVVFGDVIIRVSPDYRLEMHLDTDEGNAANLVGGATGALVDTEALGRLQRRKVKYDESAE